jgi:hypothetical protein
MSKATVLTFTIVSSLLLLSVNSVTARCPNRRMDVKAAVKSSKAVFSGIVLSVKIVNGFSEARFQVAEAWKGVDSTEVAVWADPFLAESPHYQVGESYLVFAEERDGKLYTGMCSATEVLGSTRAKEYLKQLGAGRKSVIEAAQ